LWRFAQEPLDFIAWGQNEQAISKTNREE
jgi:hypothetical protein